MVYRGPGGLMLPNFDAEELEAIARDPALASWFAMRAAEKPLGLMNFQPRPDRPEQFDEQSSFVFNRDRVSFFLKGNAAGGTEAAAFKTALFLLRQQPPPRKDTPFWIISNKYEQCIDVCWGEKLHGHDYIPECEIQWDRVSYYEAKSNRPKAVPLKPWPADRGGNPEKNWVIVFKSYEEGRSKMQASSIGGFWFSEQFPWPIFTEVLRGCRDYLFPGGQFAEFTPIDPELCVELKKVMSAPPNGWRFYRGNTYQNAPNLAEGFIDDFTASIPDELKATRLTGGMAGFEGAIYTTFDPAIHVVEDDSMLELPLVSHSRAVDWGDSEKHATVCGWGCKDRDGNWLIYDEYWTTDQTKVQVDHAIEIVARSIRWGWPIPDAVLKPAEHQAYLAKKVLERLEFKHDGPNIDERREKFLERLKKLEHKTQHFGYTYGDPSRPGSLRQFSGWGIPMAPASNDVYEGINLVRSLLKVSPFTGRPKLFIHKRCVHLIDEMGQYRWDPRKAVKPQPLKDRDDAVDMARYLLYSDSRHSDELPGQVPSGKVQEMPRSVRLERPGR